MLIPWTKGITANIWHWSPRPDTHGVPIFILSQTSAEEILCVFVVEFGMNSIPVVWKDRNGFSIRGFAAPSPSAVVPIPWQLWHGKASFQLRRAWRGRGWPLGVETTNRYAKWLFKWDIVIHKSSNRTIKMDDLYTIGFFYRRIIHEWVYLWENNWEIMAYKPWPWHLWYHHEEFRKSPTLNQCWLKPHSNSRYPLEN